jgi:23S rRNA (cytidine1920-2'-O)/16S rRNA (cytidine1409-2'-O)-methyltransferase
MKLRLDHLLVEKGYYESREKSKRAIMAGLVRLNDVLMTKAGEMVDASAPLIVEQPEDSFVSRGGNKLKKAVDVYGLNLSDKICMDIGASTGGFTDCMLQNGAIKVYAVDVGYGQLDWKLRQDPRVINLERTNIRHLDNQLITEPLDFISVDVSFISLKLVLPKAIELIKPEYEMVLLIKPQFEAGKERMKKSGVIQDPSIHVEVLYEAMERIMDLGLEVEALTFSPITGPKGNIEFLCYVKKNGIWSLSLESVKKVVLEAHEQLK